MTWINCISTDWAPVMFWVLLEGPWWCLWIRGLAMSQGQVSATHSVTLGDTSFILLKLPISSPWSEDSSTYQGCCEESDTCFIGPLRAPAVFMFVTSHPTNSCSSSWSPSPCNPHWPRWVPLTVAAFALVPARGPDSPGWRAALCPSL